MVGFVSGRSCMDFRGASDLLSPALLSSDLLSESGCPGGYIAALADGASVFCDDCFGFSGAAGLLDDLLFRAAVSLAAVSFGSGNEAFGSIPGGKRWSPGALGWLAVFARLLLTSATSSRVGGDTEELGGTYPGGKRWALSTVGFWGTTGLDCGAADSITAPIGTSASGAGATSAMLPSGGSAGKGPGGASAGSGSPTGTGGIVTAPLQ